MRWCLVAIVVCGAATAGQAPRPQDATRQCVVIVDERAGTTWRSDVDGCATRLSPASTFKIPHALVALETGVLQPDTVEKWDGSRHPAQPLWDRDHTVLTAMKPSVLWFFQRIAPRIGAERMRQWLERMHYGNADTSGDIRSYWVNGTLRISPDEQATFLRRFYSLDVPVNRPFQELVAGALEQEPGTVQNARGIHRLVPKWPAQAALNSKTGATTLASGESVSWLVGAYTLRDRRYIFATAVWRPHGGVDQLAAARLALTTLAERTAHPR